MDVRIAVRAAALQTALVVLLALILALTLPHSFFEDWGWLAGPASWFGCAALTGRVLKLPLGRVLAGAALAGLVSGIGVLTGVHWLGVALAIPLFAAWCSRLDGAADRDTAWT